MGENSGEKEYLERRQQVAEENL
jgi:hypothetical protein